MAGPDAAPQADDAEALIVDVQGFEGPLDLLLTLARSQKVDLRQISILALAEQYLAFIAEMRRRRLEVAADYLVMAAWLAFLKSRLLLPEPPANDEEASGEELAAQLAFQLRRLEAMRAAAQRLLARDRLGLQVFARGMPEGVRVVKTPQWADTLVDLLKAYTNQRLKGLPQRLEIPPLPVFAIEDARRRFERLLGRIIDWNRLDALLPEELQPSPMKRSALASMFSASLELVREGELEIRQLQTFGPIYLRRRSADQ